MQVCIAGLHKTQEEHELTLILMPALIPGNLLQSYASAWNFGIRSCLGITLITSVDVRNIMYAQIL